MGENKSDEIAEKKTGILSRFNSGLAYYLDNLFKFLFTILKFFIKISGVVFITFPFVLIGMCLVAPDSALKTLEALSNLIQLIIDIFKSIK